MEKLLFCLVFGFVPGLLWLGYFYRKDFYEPEPKKLIALGYFLGMIITIPIPYVYQLLDLGYMGNAVIMAPIVEELSKFLVLFLVFYKKKDFNEPLDGMIYAISIALGFASFENFGYMLKTYGTDAFTGTAIIRAFFSVPMHALASSLFGFALGVRKFNIETKHKLGYYILLAIAVHAGFNLLVSRSATVSYLLVIFFGYVWGKFSKNLQFSLKNSPFAE